MATLTDATVAAVVSQLLDERIGDNHGLYLPINERDEALVNGIIYQQDGEPETVFRLSLTPLADDAWVGAPWPFEENEITFRIQVSAATPTDPPTILRDARREVQRMMAVADEVLTGDSNDAEHDALYNIRESLTDLRGALDAALKKSEG